MVMYLAIALVLVAVALVAYWVMKRLGRAPPGFALLMVSSALVIGSGIWLMGRGYFPDSVRILVVPFLMILGATFRLEGLRRFLGRKVFDYR